MGLPGSAAPDLGRYRTVAENLGQSPLSIRRAGSVNPGGEDLLRVA
jgi:hypothetical protein